MGGHLFEPRHLLEIGHLFLSYETEKCEEQNFDFYLKKDQEDWKMDLLSLDPSWLK